MSDEYIIEIIEESAPTIEIVNTEKITVSDLPDYYPVAQISGLADYLNSFIVNGSGLNKVYYSNSGIVLSVTGVGGGGGGGGYTLEDIQDIIGAYVSGYSGVSVSYNDSTGYTNIFLSGLNSTYISDFNSGVSGLLPVKNIVAGPNISVSGVSGIYTIGNTMTSVETSASVVTTVFNKTGFSIPKMTAVYINGGQGDLPTIQKALATADISSAGTYGITYEAIDNMGSGRVIILGALTGLNTDQFNPTAPNGDVNGTVLYLSPTVSGALTTTKPYAPYHIVAMGTIVRTHQNAGVIEVRVQNGYELDELHNVAVTGAISGQFLKYDGYLWRNSGVSSSDISDFASAVSGISPNISISGNSGIVVNKNGNSYTVSSTGLQPSGNYSVSGHLHVSSDITNFNSSVSGLLIPYALLNSGNFNNLFVSGTKVSIDGHTHNTSQITNFNSSVSGLLPVKSITGSGYVVVTSGDGNYIIYTTGLQPSGNYSLVGHTHTASNITDFNTSTSGLLIPYALLSSGNFSSLFVAGIPVSVSGHNHTISIGSGNNIGVLNFGTNEVLNIVGSGNTNISYNDASNTLTISSVGGGGGSSNVSISGSGNGRIFTSDGTSTNLIGNSGLTYISGVLTVFDSVKIDNKNNTINIRNINNIVNSSKLYMWSNFR